MDINNEYYQDLPEYNGKTQFIGDPANHLELHPLTLWVFYAVVAALLVLTGVIEFQINIVIVLAMLALATVTRKPYHKANNSKVTIDAAKISKEYLSQHEMHLFWDEIDYISVIKQYNGTNKKVIYIKNKISENQDIRKINKIVLPYSPQLTHCIMQYWTNEIINLDSMNDWHKYINNCRG